MENVQARIDPRDYPAWTHTRPLFPWCLLLVLLTVFPAAMTLFDSIYAVRYGYHVPLLVGGMHGLLVSGRVARLREMSLMVPHSAEVYRVLGGGLARPPRTMLALAAFGPAVVLTAFLLGVAVSPTWGLGSEEPVPPDAEIARQAVPLIVLFLVAISSMAIFNAAAAVASRYFPVAFPAYVGLCAAVILASHHCWGWLQILLSMAGFLIQQPYHLQWDQGATVGFLGRILTMLSMFWLALYALVWGNRWLGGLSNREG